MVAANNHAKQKQLAQQKAETEKVVKETQETEPSKDKAYVEGTDAYLMSMQPELRKSFGTPPEGFIWDLNGKAISLGDKSMSSEDVLYAYIRSLSTLDLATAQKYSRDAKVVESVYTVTVSMLDLTAKDFWEKDKDSLYKKMMGYESKENDSTKLEILLYDYILNYYKTPTAVKRTVSLDVTLERYPDIDSGWLVSIDKDIDDAARYSNGTLVANYITEQFRQWMIEQRSNSSSNKTN